jgi:thioesterase domain-containing protein
MGRAYGYEGTRAPTTIEEMAQGYLEELCLLQPEGPCFLGGHSYGGLVALEMAQ